MAYYCLRTKTEKNTHMKEALIYLTVAFAGLFILGYSIHMLIGGMVSEATEWSIIAGAVAVGAATMAVMAWDIVRRRRRAGTRK